LDQVDGAIADLSKNPFSKRNVVLRCLKLIKNGQCIKLRTKKEAGSNNFLLPSCLPHFFSTTSMTMFCGKTDEDEIKTEERSVHLFAVSLSLSLFSILKIGLQQFS
jgi:hypothetical protein